MTSIERVVNSISTQYDIKNRARDRALIDSRQIIRHAATAIRALHRGEREKALRSLEEGRRMVDTTRDELKEHPDLYWSGYVQDAQKELAEAYLVAAITAGEDVPSPDELNLEATPYLNGLAEAASEMRRYILDTIRRGGVHEIEHAEHVLQVMDDIYTSLVTVDYPDSITGGLRRTTDALRAVLERTRGDLTLTIRQSQLERALARVETHTEQGM